MVYLAAGDESLGAETCRNEAHGARQHQFHPAPSDNFQNAVALLQARRHELLQQDMFARLGGSLYRLQVKVMRKGDAHRIDVPTIQDLTVIHVPLSTKAGRKGRKALPIRAGGSDQFQSLQDSDSLRMPLTCGPRSIMITQIIPS